LLKRNFLLQKIKETSKPCVGTWITIPSITAVEVISSSKLDFVVIDMEHAPIELETAQLMTLAAEAWGVSPILRVPGEDQRGIARALELGIHGLQIPNIDSVDSLERCIAAAKYHPRGSKGLSPFTRACNYSADNASRMVKLANSNNMVIAQVEGRLGLENLDAILKVKDVDIIFLGLFDLSNYLGIPGQLDNSRLKGLFRSLVAKIDDAGFVVGSISNTLEQLDFLIASGVRYITHSADCHILGESYRKVIQSVRKII